MRRYLVYYKRVLHHQWLFLLYAGKFGVPFIQRLFHNYELLLPRLAVPLAMSIYDSNGEVRQIPYDENKEYLKLSDSFKSSKPYYVEYWVAHNWKVVPSKYLRIFLAERYVDCELDMERFLVSNRDLLFLADVTNNNKYGEQLDSIISNLKL